MLHTLPAAQALPQPPQFFASVSTLTHDPAHRLCSAPHTQAAFWQMAPAPHTVLQTVDATTGQNALNQVEIFRNIAGVNGLVMTKLDGTARGGILVAIAAKHKLPVYFIGVGEQVDDLEPFSASEFARAIAGVA